MIWAKLKVSLRRLFCRHKFIEAKKVGFFQVLSGDRIYIVCEKCGKEKGSYFVRED